MNNIKKQLSASTKEQPPELWGFHGTAEANIDSIVTKGFDAAKFGSAVGQVYGRGAYFAADPKVSVGYCASGKKMILCNLVMSDKVIFVAQHNYYVIEDVEAILPCFIITWKA